MVSVERIRHVFPKGGVTPSFRMRQVEAMFDAPLSERTEEVLTFERPDEARPWQIGAIVGASGSGKSTAARVLFGDAYRADPPWPGDAAIIDAIGAATLSEGIQYFLSVGLGSAPCWLRPYYTLSEGEQFRCRAARLLLNAERSENMCDKTIVIDEFSNTLDRTTARFASLAISKRVRKSANGVRLAAVTCHDDVLEWLQPDWVLEMPSGTLQWRGLRRLSLPVELRRVDRKAWRLFSRWHYLAGGGSARGGAVGNVGRGLSPTARCYGVWANDELATFCAAIPLIGKKKHWRITRLVTAPCFQGVGIGGWTLDALGDVYLREGLRMSITTGHPAVLRHCQHSPCWRLTGYSKRGRVGARSLDASIRGSRGRSSASFEYVLQYLHEGGETMN